MNVLIEAISSGIFFNNAEFWGISYGIHSKYDKKLGCHFECQVQTLKRDAEEVKIKVEKEQKVDSKP